MSLDVVYFLKDDPKNDELRHSLRSLRNLPHDRVFVVGGPPWLRNVERIPFETKSDKWLDGQSKLEAACHWPEVSDEFVCMNDDFFVMRPLDELPVYHRGPLMSGRYSSSPWVYGQKRAYDYLVSRGIEKPVSYELHIPIVLNKGRMVVHYEELRRDRQFPQPYFRTIYGNLEGIGGERVHDVKYGLTTEAPQPAIPFLSTNDNSFRHGYVGDVIRAAFKTASEYE